ncbi:MAG: hypothetical protein LBP70_02105 [Mycoplasmataceae bacterium]|jgi:predicted anti-sigma-YlaC factor YlaD|nr:hypothetical protein [Mycoplasmataceae bacterium]
MTELEKLKAELIRKKIKNEDNKIKQFEIKQELAERKHELSTDKFINQKKRYRNASVMKWIMFAITVIFLIVVVIVCVHGATNTITYN